MYEEHYHDEYGFSFILCSECFQPTPASLVDEHWRDNHITPFEMMAEMREAGIYVNLLNYRTGTRVQVQRYKLSYWRKARMKTYFNKIVDDPEATLRELYAAWRKR